VYKTLNCKSVSEYARETVLKVGHLSFLTRVVNCPARRVNGITTDMNIQIRGYNHVTQADAFALLVLLLPTYTAHVKIRFVNIAHFISCKKLFSDVVNA